MLLLLIVLIGSWSVPVLFAAPVQADTVTVSVDPPDVAVKAGDKFEINITINGVQDLGAFELSLRYDPALVQVDTATFGKFIGSTERDFVPLGPTIAPTTGQVAAGALTMGTLPGAQGQGVLLTLSCTAMRAGQGQLSLATVRISDTAGKPIAATGVDGKVTFTGDVVVPTATPAPVTPTATLAPATATAAALPTLEATTTAAPNGTSAPEPSATIAATPIPVETLMVIAATETAQAWRTAEVSWTPTPTATATLDSTAMLATATAEVAAGSPTSTKPLSAAPVVTPAAPSAETPATPAGGSGTGLAVGLGIAAVGLGAGGAYLWRRGRQKSS